MKIYVDQIPDDMTVLGYIKKNTDWLEACKVEPRKKYPNQLQFKIIDFDADRILASVNQALAIYGDHGWKSSGGDSTDYTGFSLVYNPNHQEDHDIHSSTLGTRNNKTGEFFWGHTTTHSFLKNSYFDTFGFRMPTPASQHGELGLFFSRLKRSMVRGRLSSINGLEYKRRQRNTGWHKDEPIFENLRLNIPLSTSENYLFEMEGHNPCHLDIGYAYTWDTHKPHTVYNTKRTEGRRTHLVIGTSAWWDYDNSDDSWSTNEFYGVKHPFDMLVDGDVFRGLVQTF
jgi:hypothetical protein